MTVKDKVRAILDELPDDCTADDIQYRLFVIQSIDRGINADDDKTAIPADVARERLLQWRTK